MNPVSATDNYLNMVLSQPGVEPITVLAVFFLTLARLLPILTLAPFLGAKNVPMTIRMMFAVALVAIFLPQNLLLIQGEIPYGITFIGLILKELIIGTALGFFAAAPFYFAQMAGSVIDHQRGSSALQVTDPTTQTQTGDIGILYNYVLIAMFFLVGGPFLFFNGLATSYALIPVDGLISPSFFNLHNSIWPVILGVLQHMFNLSIQLAAPALVGILISDMFLGIANRLAPQVQIVFLGISLKSWVGLALLTAAWGLIIQVMTKEGVDWIKGLNELISQLGHRYVLK